MKTSFPRGAQSPSYNWAETLLIATATFLAYFCMYMFRKPYTAGAFESFSLGGWDFKVILVLAQAVGYTSSKWLGVKLISELPDHRRIQYLIGCLGIAWLALVGLALFPRLGWLFMFLNGLPLGLVWGIVFRFMEGRRMTEFLTVILSLNFILSSGIAKSIGSYLIQMGMVETQMPMLIGIGIFPILFFSIWLLGKIQPPSEADVKQRKVRVPMNRSQRTAFLKAYAWPIGFILTIYLVLTIIRDIRDNFAPEIWAELGYTDDASIFIQSEWPVTILLLFLIGLLFLIKQNWKALWVSTAIGSFGVLLLVVSTYFQINDWISPWVWMVLSGAGLFLPYILLNGILFDRMLAVFQISGNVGFIMYMADSLGYLGSLLILVLKLFDWVSNSWLELYRNLIGIGGLLLILCFMGLAIQWYLLHRKKEYLPLSSIDS